MLARVDMPIVSDCIRLYPEGPAESFIVIAFQPGSSNQYPET